MSDNIPDFKEEIIAIGPGQEYHYRYRSLEYLRALPDKALARLDHSDTIYVVTNLSGEFDKLSTERVDNTVGVLIAIGKEFNMDWYERSLSDIPRGLIISEQIRTEHTRQKQLAAELNYNRSMRHV